MIKLIERYSHGFLLPVCIESISRLTIQECGSVAALQRYPCLDGTGIQTGVSCSFGYMVCSHILIVAAPPVSLCCVLGLEAKEMSGLSGFCYDTFEAISSLAIPLA